MCGGGIACYVVSAIAVIVIVSVCMCINIGIYVRIVIGAITVICIMFINSMTVGVGVYTM